MAKQTEPAHSIQHLPSLGRNREPQTADAGLMAPAQIPAYGGRMLAIHKQVSCGRLHANTPS